MYLETAMEGTPKSHFFVFVQVSSMIVKNRPGYKADSEAETRLKKISSLHTTVVCACTLGRRWFFLKKLHLQKDVKRLHLQKKVILVLTDACTDDFIYTRSMSFLGLLTPPDS